MDGFPWQARWRFQLVGLGAADEYRHLLPVNFAKAAGTGLSVC
jgi:hypothetical protein